MNPDILQYRKELLTAAPKNRKAKRMLCKEFDLSLQPLLEDIPSPTYQDLMDAFGSPSHMAQTLLDSIHVPPPLSCKQKLGIALGIVCTILCIIFLIFYSFNRPENDLSFGDVSDYPLSRLCDEFVFCGTETFNDNDTDWTQPRGYHHYLVLLNNTGSCPVQITIRYSKYQDPHVFQVPENGSTALLVQDANYSEHTISFDSPDGALSGTVQVLIQE